MKTPELEVAEDAARAAGAILSRYFRDGVAMRSKDVANLVSDADIEAEQAIGQVIKRAFPGHEVLGEETHHGDSSAADLWVVDPLDGTNNFAHRIPHFAISIAYWHAGAPEVGVIYNPISDDWYRVVRSQGAFYGTERARVGEQSRLDEVLVGAGFYYDRGAMMESTLDSIRDLKRRHIHGIRRCGTASLDLCRVGLGMYGAYFEYELSPWDFAAGALFVTEAGGRVTTARGGPLPLARTSLLASNGLLHEPVLEIVRAHHPGGAEEGG
jgi:myo-inositol-1(or 4)-monophosphatase